MSRADATRARRGAGMVRHPLAALLALLACVVSQPGGWHASAAQSSVSDADLERASVGRTLRLGSASTPHRVTTVSLESYVARVLAGEGEPAAPDVTQQALAIAIRTFALKNAGRHAREGFDVCDGTHCQVPRASTPATRRAALASAGRVLTYNGSAAEVFYSASCGGRSAACW